MHSDTFHTIENIFNSRTEKNQKHMSEAKLNSIITIITKFKTKINSMRCDSGFTLLLFRLDIYVSD